MTFMRLYAKITIIGIFQEDNYVMKNLVITGMGAVTPIGIGVDNYWQGIMDMKCGIEKVTRFDDDDTPIDIAGEGEGF